MVLGNKATWLFTFREQLREQKENKTENTGTKVYFREQGTPKIEKILLGNGRNTWNKGTMTAPSVRPSFFFTYLN